jgi:hypothetical protein
MAWAEELVQITSGVGPYLNRRLNERKAYVAREQFPTRGDKGARAQSIRALMATNGLYVPVNNPWYQAFRAELLAFPTARHDDQVDALGLIGQLLDRMIIGNRPAKDKSERKEWGTTTWTTIRLTAMPKQVHKASTGPRLTAATGTIIGRRYSYDFPVVDEADGARKPTG